jgi:predicted negative regulator of RcsB-dependent stress response
MEFFKNNKFIIIFTIVLSAIGYIFLYIKEEKNQNLSKTFEKFAIISKKAKGTIRNMYYAMTKLSKTDLEFTSKYLNGTPLSVAKVKEFTKEEEDKAE